MSNYVLKYSRDERVKYISHLDFIRTFHRTVRRAGLLMSFSQGFNPHPVMTIAMPLSVGVTSDSEYIKIGFQEDYAETEIMEKLNKAFPVGFKILAARKTEGKELDFAKLDRAIYDVELEWSGNSFDAQKFLGNKELTVMKKSKSGEKEADIRPYIHEFQVTSQSDDKMTITMCLASGNNYNLKPDTVISAMEKYTDGFKVDFFATHRAKILAGDKELL
ncbi:MAG: TIGR03936 family radical SAM-associated protein [Clostridia bacterium]|nr:TIGR03936 family radical SAM-associated protein [Clostridia bacterium]